MKRSTLTLVIVVPALALMLFALLVPTSGNEYAWFSRFMSNPAEREAYERWFATRDTVRAMRLELEQVEAVERAEEAQAPRSAAGSAARGPSADTLTIIAEPLVGDEARARVTEAVRQELAALGASSPLHPITIILERDSTLRFHYRRTVVLPHETDGACTVLVRERGRSTSFAGIAPGDRALGACAFFAAYGEPGRGMLEWLSESRMGTAAYLLGPTESARWRERPPGVNPAGVNAAGVSSHVAACRAGRPAGCLRQFNGDEVEAPIGMFLDRVPWFKFDGVASYNPNSFHVGDSQAETSEGLLGALAADLGPAAFARVWASDSNPDVAYEVETGEPLHRWVSRRMDRLVTEYHAGPLPPMSRLAALAVLMAAIVTVTMGFARRRLS